MIMCNVTDIEEIRDELKEAASDNHRYAENYQFDKMKKRWDKYLQFYLLKDEEKSVAMGGIVKFGDNLVRICDRYCTLRSYRRFGINKFIKKNIRFCNGIFKLRFN